MLYDLNILKKIYDDNMNLMEYMRKESNTEYNTVEQIMLSYDFQSGSYIKKYNDNPQARVCFLKRLSEIIIEHNLSGTLLEAGVGEATSMIPLLNLIGKNRFQVVYGFDIAWSRIKVAKQFSKNQCYENINFSTGDLLNIPFVDNYFDLVYTVHAIEPNGGKEKEILQELYRVCKKYLILLEPCFKFANDEARQRMIKHGYVTRLSQVAMELNYNVETYELYGSLIDTPLNPTGIMIIKKDSSKEKGINLVTDAPYACPISKKPMKQYDDSFYCPDSMLSYPIIQNIPCLTPNNAIVTTKYF